MRGIVFLGNRKLELREFPDPTPGPGEVVLEMKASGMCGSDLHPYRAAGNAAAALDWLGPALAPAAAQFRERLRAGMYDGTLTASTASTLATLLHYAEGRAPLDAWQGDGLVDALASPGALLDQLSAALTGAIDELTRPVDAIKHQAKTVTVGISRSDESLVTVPLVRELLAAGAARDRLSYGTLRTVAALDPAVARVTGFTRYQVELDASGSNGTISIVDRGGISAGMPSRTEHDQRLRGTKQLVAAQRQVLAARGRSDGRTFILVPEAKDGHTTGLVLLHVEFQRRLPAERMRRVLDGYHGRLTALRGAVTETEPAFDESLLGELPVERLLTEPVEVLADHWTSRGAPAAPSAGA